MFDIKWIRENPDAFDEGLNRRALAPMAAELVEMDRVRREHQTTAQEIQAERNKLSKEIGQAKSRGEDASGIMAQVSESKEAEARAEDAAKEAEAKLNDVLSGIPNLPFDDVPVGTDESDNVEVRTWGDARNFDFEPKEHFDIGEDLGLMDFERATKISGARFVLLTGALARMERALAAFMLDTHTQENGYTEVNPPALVNDDTMYGTGQLPKFAEDLFRTEDGLWLIPTAEVPMTNIVRGEILDTESLPRRYTAQTWCFRSEAGSAGRDTRGMIRQHQFTKVELVSVTTADKSMDELERMTASAEGILQRLELPYRTVVLSTGDMGFGARKTYDIEVWLPAQNTFREISSCSHFGDFQSRRAKIRFRPDGGGKPVLAHTINGSGLAVGRTLVAILENYQTEDGSVLVPEVLQPYMRGLDRITAAE